MSRYISLRFFKHLKSLTSCRLAGTGGEFSENLAFIASPCSESVHVLGSFGKRERGWRNCKLFGQVLLILFFVCFQSGFLKREYYYKKQLPLPPPLLLLATAKSSELVSRSNESKGKKAMILWQSEKKERERKYKSIRSTEGKKRRSDGGGGSSSSKEKFIKTKLCIKSENEKKIANQEMKAKNENQLSVKKKK